MTTENTEQGAEALNLDALLDSFHGAEADTEGAAKEEKPVEEVKEQETESDEGAEQEAEHTEEENEPEAEVEAEKKKSKYIPRDRFDSVNEAKKNLESQLEAERRKNQELADLIKKSLGGDKKQSEHDDLEPLDPETTKKIEERIQGLEAKIEAERFAGAMEAENARFTAIDPDFQEKVRIVIALDARDLIMAEGLSQQDAYKQAAIKNMEVFQKIHKRGGSVGEFILSRANPVYAALKGEVQKKAPTPQAKSGVNVKELERLRAEAGAPTNKSATSKAVAYDLDGMLASFHNEARGA